MIRALIVDDEAPARRKLRRLLASEVARDAGFEVAGQAADGEAAVEAIRELAPDVVFLDVQMPGLDGFGVIGEVGVGQMPLVVFATAYDEHALRAFEVHAFDYLLKPFARRRFDAVLERVARRLAERRDTGRRDETPADDLAERLASLLGERTAEAASRSEAPLKRLRLRAGEEREVLVGVGEIARIEADGNYVVVHARDGRRLRRRDTLKSLAARLPEDDFVRINRSEIVNLDAVAELQPFFHGDYRVLMEDGSVRNWSRRYRPRADSP